MSRTGSRLLGRFLYSPGLRSNHQLRLPKSCQQRPPLSAASHPIQTMTVVNGTGPGKPVLFLYVPCAIIRKLLTEITGTNGIFTLKVILTIVSTHEVSL